MIRSAISPRFAIKTFFIVRRKRQFYPRSSAARPRENPLGGTADKQRRNSKREGLPYPRGLLQLSEEISDYCIVTPPAFFSSFFRSFSLRAPIARWLHSSALARSALRAASSPHARSALRRKVSCRYCIASS